MINFSILISTPQVQLSGTRYSINTLSIVDIIRLDTQPFSPLIGFSQISRQRKLVHDSTTFHSRTTYTTQRMLERDRTLGNAVQATGYTMVIQRHANGVLRWGQKKRLQEKKMGGKKKRKKNLPRAIINTGTTRRIARDSERGIRQHCNNIIRYTDLRVEMTSWWSTMTRSLAFKSRCRGNKIIWVLLS